LPPDYDRIQRKTVHIKLWKELAKFLGCELINTCSYNLKANGLVERYHRILKASIKAQSDPSEWYSNLGWILLGLRSTIREDMELSPAELVYGSSLRLPGEYFSNSNSNSKGNLSPADYVQQAQAFVQNIKPTPVRKHPTWLVHVDSKLFTCSHVFVRHDAPMQ